MRTTLDLPDLLFKEVKTRAVQQGIKLKDLLAIYIESGLRNPEISGKDRVARKNPHPLPVAWEADGSVTPYRSNAEIYAILEVEDIENFQRVSSLAKSKPCNPDGSVLTSDSWYLKLYD
jgi:hypothetical protein